MYDESVGNSGETGWRSTGRLTMILTLLLLVWLAGIAATLYL